MSLWPNWSVFSSKRNYHFIFIFFERITPKPNQFPFFLNVADQAIDPKVTIFLHQGCQMWRFSKISHIILEINHCYWTFWKWFKKIFSMKRQLVYPQRYFRQLSKRCFKILKIDFKRSIFWHQIWDHGNLCSYLRQE